MIPSYISTDLIYNFQRKKIHQWFGKDKRDYYITMGEICRIRKEVLKADIWLNGNDACSTWIWVDNLKLEGDFVYYKDKQDPFPDRSDLVDNLFILCIQTKFQKDAYEQLGNGFLGIDTTHNITIYKGILLFILMVQDKWGHGM